MVFEFWILKGYNNSYKVYNLALLVEKNRNQSEKGHFLKYSYHIVVHVNMTIQFKINYNYLSNQKFANRGLNITEGNLSKKKKLVNNFHL